VILEANVVATKPKINLIPTFDDSYSIRTNSDFDESPSPTHKAETLTTQNPINIEMTA